MPPWNAEALNEKMVKCIVRDADGAEETIGRLVAEEKGGELSVELWIQEVTADNQLTLNRIALPAAYVEKLQASPDKDVDFILPGELNLVPGEE